MRIELLSPKAAAVETRNSLLSATKLEALYASSAAFPAV
ncbi:hypothetical protein PpBr36_02245 [Pyricularia pennisetigena]|nr:hypothetical protein PpBr36_02245 [Pyricularia pennisetigena]TLS30039.1 hypothetical protein PpBr36_02245 [Pyricularia pennisetigena]